MEAWGAQAEQLLEWAEPSLAILVLCWRAAASAIRPRRAARLLAAAGDTAAQSRSTLAIGYVHAWRIGTELCPRRAEHPIPAG
jgi:hypothetical protein